MKAYTSEEMTMMTWVLTDRGHDAYNWIPSAIISMFEALTKNYGAR